MDLVDYWHSQAVRGEYREKGHELFGHEMPAPRDFTQVQLYFACFQTEHIRASQGEETQ